MVRILVPIKDHENSIDVIGNCSMLLNSQFSKVFKKHKLLKHRKSNKENRRGNGREEGEWNVMFAS